MSSELNSKENCCCKDLCSTICNPAIVVIVVAIAIFHCMIKKKK
jgi:hypothetical protein